MLGLKYSINTTTGKMKPRYAWLLVFIAALLIPVLPAAYAVGSSKAAGVDAHANAFGLSKQESALSFLEQFSGNILAGTVLMGLLLFIGWTIYRRHHESEVRLLTGSYISDGVEAAWLKFPELLKTGADVQSAKALATLASFADPENEEFFSWADRNIKVMRKVLGDLGALFEPSARQPVLADLLATLESFKSKTSKAELRPAWQLAFVIELLVYRLRERPSEVTLSTTRTVSSALDVLAAACQPGVRPDLILDPPLAVLAVDDDPLCLRAIAFALQKAGLTPDTAVDGTSAVNKCQEKSYDVVFMDIMMPGMDGLEACQRLRNLKSNANTPVVFVTARSDFQTRERSAEVGGAELIAKPFLVTELTVKAVSFSMRKRLNLPVTASSGVADTVVIGTPLPAAKSLPLDDETVNAAKAVAASIVDR